MDDRERILEAAEEAQAGTWLEAAERLIEQQEQLKREKLEGSSLDRSEARRWLIALDRLRSMLRSDKALSKRKVVLEASSDPLVRRMRRADLLCSKDWRERMRSHLLETAKASERQFIEGGIDQDIIDALTMRKFVAMVDSVAMRGEHARQQYARKKVA